MASRNCWWELLASLLAITLALIHMVEASYNSEIDALSALRGSLSDPSNELCSWDPTYVNPFLWSRITCNSDNSVIRVDLGHLNLSGHIAPDFGNLPNLQYLELYGNNIQGTIPSELRKLKSLISMDLYNNMLTGQIPTSFGNLKSLRMLRLNNNKLTGTVPKEAIALHLDVFNVSGNNIK